MGGQPGGRAAGWPAHQQPAQQPGSKPATLKGCKPAKHSLQPNMRQACQASTQPFGQAEARSHVPASEDISAGGKGSSRHCRVGRSNVLLHSTCCAFPGNSGVGVYGVRSDKYPAGDACGLGFEAEGSRHRSVSPACQEQQLMSLAGVRHAQQGLSNALAKPLVRRSGTEGWPAWQRRGLAAADSSMAFGGGC